MSISFLLYVDIPPTKGWLLYVAVVVVAVAIVVRIDDDSCVAKVFVFGVVAKVLSEDWYSTPSSPPNNVYESQPTTSGDDWLTMTALGDVFVLVIGVAVYV